MPAYVYAGICLPDCLPTWFTDSRRYSRRKCVPTSRTRLSCETGSALPARHSSARLTARPDCAVQVYSAVSTSGRGKGVPRRSYTHATRHRRSMANKEKRKKKKRRAAESRATNAKASPRGIGSVSPLNRVRALSATTLNQANAHANEHAVSRYYVDERKLRRSDPSISFRLSSRFAEIAKSENISVSASILAKQCSYFIIFLTIFYILNL